MLKINHRYLSSGQIEALEITLTFSAITKKIHKESAGHAKKTYMVYECFHIT